METHQNFNGILAWLESVIGDHYVQAFYAYTDICECLVYGKFVHHVSAGVSHTSYSPDDVQTGYHGYIMYLQVWVDLLFEMWHLMHLKLN